MSKKSELTKTEMMREISARVGKEKAIDMVMQSYNTELLANSLHRLESGRESMIGGYKRRDHLADAMRRVMEVCELG